MAGRGTTIAEIAATAGVSVPTISRVLNGRPGVSPERRAEIERLLVTHGYVRRSRGGRGGRSGPIYFVITDLETQWAMTLLRGAEAEAGRLGYDLVVKTTHGMPVGTPDWVDHVVKRGSSGIVLVVSELPDTSRAKLKSFHVPIVLVDPVGTGPHAATTVAATDWAGGRDATEHLLGLGHRRIGFITGPLSEECHRDRLDGYRTALLRAGIEPAQELVRNGDSLMSGGLREAPGLLRLPDPPTAIISGSDEQAYGVYQAARTLGLVVPDDLSVVGFDDVELCQWVSPQLTTVRQPLEEMAREATRLVAELATDSTRPNQRIELSTSMVVRESTAPPRVRQAAKRSAGPESRRDGSRPDDAALPLGQET
jgi:DNA-binding LacI/PurR family transcriptional regulator